MDARRDDVMAAGRLARLLFAAAVACAAPQALGQKKGEKEKEGRNTSYGAIAYHAPSKSVGWATDFRTSRDARVAALRQCEHEGCIVVGTVTRGCAALAASPKASIVQKGATRQEAEAKSLAKCGPGCQPVAWVCTR